MFYKAFILLIIALKYNLDAATISIKKISIILFHIFLLTVGIAPNYILYDIFYLDLPAGLGTSQALFFNIRLKER